MKTVLFYPDPPVQLPGHTLSRTIKYFIIMGYEFAKSINENWDIGVYWNLMDVNTPPPELLQSGKRVLNIRCNNVTKSFVDKAFTKAFGYSTFVDTSRFGFCVRKSEKQSAHDGQIVRMPCEKEDGYIYQILFDNRMNIDRIYDIRVPYFLGKIPCVFIKSKTFPGTFENEHCPQKIYWVSPVEDWLTRDEVEKIVQFCNIVGLDVGEVDAVRDNSTGKLFLIDVNNIPGNMLMRYLPDAPNEEKKLADFFQSILECQ